MRKPFKIFLYFLLGGIGLAVAGFVSIQLFLVWSFRTQTYDPGDSEFANVAVRTLESFAGGALPPGVRINRYVSMPNFNDGSELWEIVMDNRDELFELVARLKLRPVAPNQYFPKLDEPSSRIPNWVERPSLDMKWLYVLDETYCHTRRCNPVHYFWSSDGSRFFLYRITS